KRKWCTRLEDCPQGLIKPFFDGMLEGATGDTQFIEGDEFAYGLRDEQQFQSEAQALRTELPSYSGNPHLYRQRFWIALPVWIDYQSKTQAWSETDEQRNYYSSTR